MSGIRFFKTRSWEELGSILLAVVLLPFFPWSAVLAGALVVGLAQLNYVAQCWKKIWGVNDAANPLALRMATLGLDPVSLRLLDPALMRHMQRQCTLCDERQYCLQVLTDKPSGSALQNRGDWRDYCSNAFVLDMLSGLQSRSKSAPKY